MKKAEDPGLSELIAMLAVLGFVGFVTWGVTKSRSEGLPYPMKDGKVYTNLTYLDCPHMLAITESPGNPEEPFRLIQLDPSCREICPAWEKENAQALPVMLRLREIGEGKTCEFK